MITIFIKSKKYQFFLTSQLGAKLGKIDIKMVCICIHYLKLFYAKYNDN